MSKEIIFFHPYFSNGGVERTNIGLAKGLLDHGYHVVFLTTSYSEHFLDEVFKLGIEFISLGNKPISMIVFDLISFLNNRSIDRNIVFISCQYYVNVISMVASLLIKRRKNVFFINSERNHINELKAILAQVNKVSLGYPKPFPDRNALNKFKGKTLPKILEYK